MDVFLCGGNNTEPFRQDGDLDRCDKCGSRDVHIGYGLMCGGLGGYTICEACSHVLEFVPDVEEE